MTMSMDMMRPRGPDVFRILPTGSTNADISSELYLSETTVKTHISKIFIELGCAHSSWRRH
ncbi:LuxR C-terminal-related transcriptional regulator [Rhodococcoides navarretei]|uniref:LuxR C-terminal-related transcriptional regulator n=1 Tax=Rhodococcus navarretei TaxID=3128981 RepID=A0ABU9CTJ8_9NOCA